VGDDGFDSDIVRSSDWDPEIVPPVDPDTGMSAGFATATGTVLGIEISTVCFVVAGFMIVGLLIYGLAPLFVSVTPPQTPHLADAMQDPISEESLRALAEAARQKNTGNTDLASSVHDPNYTLPPDAKLIPDTNPLWEQELQAQRLAAGPRDWPELLRKHREIYRKLGVDPCTSGFFPEGCSK